VRLPLQHQFPSLAPSLHPHQLRSNNARFLRLHGGTSPPGVVRPFMAPTINLPVPCIRGTTFPPPTKRGVSPVPSTASSWGLLWGRGDRSVGRRWCKLVHWHPSMAHITAGDQFQKFAYRKQGLLLKKAEVPSPYLELTF